MWPNSQFPMDLVTFTDEILNGKLHFLCCAWNGSFSNQSENFYNILISYLGLISWNTLSQLKYNSVEKQMNIQKALFFSFLKKTKPIKQKKVINISHLIMLLIKMRLLMFLVLNGNVLACKYRIVSQIWKYIIGCRIASSDISGIALSYF